MSDASPTRPPFLVRALAAAAAAVPLVYLPGRYEGFLVPRELWTLGVVAPLALLVLLRDAAARARAAAGLGLVAVFAAALFAPHLKDGDAAAALKTLRLVGVLGALHVAGAALGPAGAALFLRRLAAATVAVVAVGALRRLFGFPAFLPDRADVGLAATIGNSNALAEFLLPAGAAACVGFFADRPARALHAAAAVAAAVGVVWSESRAALLAAGVVALVALVALAFGGGATALRAACAAHRRRALVVAAALVVVAAVVLVAPWCAPLRARLASAWDPAHPTNVVRLRTWSATLDLVADRPAGVGGGRFDAAFLPYRDPIEWRLSGADSRVDHPHQEFLAAAAEGGPAVLALLALCALAFVRARRRLLDSDPATAALGRTLLLVASAFVVFACLRAPLRHPSGALAFLLLLGAAGPTNGRSGRVGVFAATAVFAAALVAAGKNATQDAALFRAVDALNVGKGLSESKDLARMSDAFAAAGRALKDVGLPGDDFARAYRAAVAADELSALREGLEAAGDTETAARLPAASEAVRLVDAVLAQVPAHPGAWTLRASLARRAGRTLDAEQTLLQAIALLPRAPRFRANLAALYLDMARDADASPLVAEKLAEAARLLRVEAELGGPAAEADRAAAALATLRTGSDATSFGALLGKVGNSAPPSAAEAAREARDAGRLDDARRLLLVALYDAPADGRLLDELATTCFLLARKTPDGPYAEEARRAFARSRVRFAVAAEEAGVAPPDANEEAKAAAETAKAQARQYARLAVQRAPRLWDARFVAARIAARAGDAASAAAELKALAEAGAPAALVAARAADEPALRDLAR